MRRLRAPVANGHVTRDAGAREREIGRQNDKPVVTFIKYHLGIYFVARMGRCPASRDATDRVLVSQRGHEIFSKGTRVKSHSRKVKLPSEHYCDEGREKGVGGRRVGILTSNR